MSDNVTTIDGNEAAASVAFRVNEVCGIYPITPSSPMGEFADEWASQSRTNIWGTTPHVVELQSEGGASGAVHGALQTGALTTTFTASQGLLLMIPNMYKIAGELTATVFHVTARTLATHALSIFGDHSDVMATRSTGWAMLASASVQEVHDMACIAQAATLASRIPFLHFFDGFRTSHEIDKVSILTDDQLREMIDDELVAAHRARGLSPDHPVIRGTAQNPDVFFQARETINPFYDKTPGIVQDAMDRFAKLTGRAYKAFDYYGDPEAERVVVVMASGAQVCRETVDYLNRQGEKVGMIQVRLYRPFSAAAFLQALPATLTGLAVLDRTKEPGSAGEPMYQDVLTVLGEALMDDALPVKRMPRVIGGRYGLSSKEFTPAMVKAVLDELKKDPPKNHFTVGIHDDVGHTSLPIDPDFLTESERTVRAMFFGLGSDGTVGANKNSIKIIGEETDNNAQGYFVYDSKKSGSRTVSHLRFGPDDIHSRYLVQAANFIGCHQFNFLEKTDVLGKAAKGAVFLLNSPYPADAVWEKLPVKVQRQILDKELQLYVIDAYDVAAKTGMGTRINTIMQTCFFAISGVLPRDEAIAKIKAAIKKTYGKKGEEIVRKNFEAVDQTLAHLHPVDVPSRQDGAEIPPVVPDSAPTFVREVTAMMMADRGDELPVSAMPVDGTFPTGTTKWEKRNVSLVVPVWDPDVCTQCGSCSMVCPHGVIRAKTYLEGELDGAPEGFKSVAARGKNVPEGLRYTLQLSVEDCTGCELCVEICPAKNKEQVGLKALNLQEKAPLLAQEQASWTFFQELQQTLPGDLNLTLPKDLQLRQPLFEFSGACAGCGETPYVKILSQMYGDRAIIANATGCSSIYCGNLPTTPWTTDEHGRGPAWSNSLFEDNAEFGLGFRLTVDKLTEYARELVARQADAIGRDLADAILASRQTDETEINAQRARVADLKKRLTGRSEPAAAQLLSVADNLVQRSVWAMGGDGWAYDIGYGGLDHVLATGRNINILVMDTEVYSNTGGQMSKATPLGAVAKFAAAGKRTGKKDLGMIAMSYGHIYVARIAMGANPRQTLRAFQEAEAFDGPSLIIAYSHCIAHGIDMKQGLRQQKLAVDSGHWILCRYNPDLAKDGKNPLQIDCKKPSIPLQDYIYSEIRYKMLTRSKPDVAKRLLVEGQEFVNERWAVYEKMAAGNGAS